MQGNFLTTVTALAVGATLGVAIPAAAQTAPPMGGGYTNVIPIPVEGVSFSSTSAIARPYRSCENGARTNLVDAAPWAPYASAPCATSTL